MLTRERLVTVEQSQSQRGLGGNMVVGAVAGAGVGLAGGIAALMSSPIVEASVQMASVGSFGMTLPLMLASCLAGVGTIAGAFLDLTKDTDRSAS